MLVYLILAGIALLLTAVALANLVRLRFPHPADVATLSIAYYGVPLSFAGYFDWNFDNLAFLAPFAADQGLAFRSMGYIVLALLALQAGRRLGQFAGPATLTRFGGSSRLAYERLRLAFIGLIGLIGVGVFLFGVQEFLSGYATEAVEVSGATGNAVIYATLEFMGLAIGYALILQLIHGRLPFKLMIAVCMAILLGVLAIRAKRLEIVSAFIPPAIMLLSRRSSLGQLSWRLVGGIAALIVLVGVAAWRLSYELNARQVIFLLFSEGLYAGHSLPGILERLETQTLDYEYGLRFPNALLAFVPRFVWEGKDDMIYAGNLALEGVAPLGATNLLAEVVLQGGLVAVAICYAAMGFVFDRIMRFQDAWDQSIAAGVIPARFGAYLIALAIFIPHFRDGIIPAFKMTLQAGVFFILLSGMRLFRRPDLIAAPVSQAEASEQPSALT